MQSNEDSKIFFMKNNAKEMGHFAWARTFALDTKGLVSKRRDIAPSLALFIKPLEFTRALLT